MTAPLLLDPIVRKRIETALGSGAMTGGWLFTGPAHIGKGTLALHLAAVLLSGEKGLDRVDPDVAAKVGHEGHPDLFILRRTADEKTGKMRSAIRVDDVRDMISRMQRTASTGRRVAIVDPADAMNPQAANALLKTLEEPPAGTAMFLLTTAPGRLLATIRSRCRQLDLREIDAATISGWLTAREEATEEDAAAAAAMAGGRPGRALSWLTGEGRAAHDMADTLLTAAVRGEDIVAAAIPFGRKDADQARREAQELVLDRLAHAARALARGDTPPRPFGGGGSPLPLIEARDAIRVLFRDGDRLNADPVQTALAVAIRLGNGLTEPDARR